MAIDPTQGMSKPALPVASCSFCEEPIDLSERGLKEVAPDQNIYCNKKCMGGAQTKRATITVRCAYCQEDFNTLRGRHSDSNIFCNKTCAFSVRKDRYFWTILSVLSNNKRFLSADEIRASLKTRKVDLTAMRIATRISSSPFVNVNRETEPFTYQLKAEYTETPWLWHTSKYYRKIGMTRKDYAAQFQ
jgi:hypothetical protein